MDCDLFTKIYLKDWLNLRNLGLTKVDLNKIMMNMSDIEANTLFNKKDLDI